MVVTLTPRALCSYTKARAPGRSGPENSHVTQPKGSAAVLLHLSGSMPADGEYGGVLERNEQHGGRRLQDTGAVLSPRKLLVCQKSWALLMGGQHLHSVSLLPAGLGAFEKGCILGGCC